MAVPAVPQAQLDAAVDVDLLRPPPSPSPPLFTLGRRRSTLTPPPDDDGDTMLAVPPRPYQGGRRPGQASSLPSAGGYRRRCCPASPTSSAPESPQRSRSPSPSPWLLSPLSPGYELYRQSLAVPSSFEYGEASSDDLSSEWDSDVQDVAPFTPKVNLQGGYGVGQGCLQRAWAVPRYASRRQILENALSLDPSLCPGDVAPTSMRPG